MANILQQFQEALLSIDRANAKRILFEMLERVSLSYAIESLIVDSLENIGSGWESGEYSLSQVYMSGKICEELVEILLPPQSDQQMQAPRMAIGLLIDYHALGKRIVYSNLRAAGFNLLDYGRMDPEALVERILHDDIQLMLLSVLMLPSAWHVKKVREMLDAKSSQVKIVVGGAPFRLDKQLWEQVGADAVGYTASDAISIVQSFIEGGK
jgi:methanogenic corrinoid protein MtbC1